MNRNNLSNFEWQAEGDTATNLAPAASEKSGSGRSKRRRFTAVAFVLVVLGATFLTWRLLARQADRATDVAREQLLVAHQLVNRAAAQQDGELFLALLLDHDPAWVELQQELLKTGLFFDRAALVWTASGQQPVVTAVHLSPDLQRAEVVFQQSYTVPAPDGPEARALFQHSVVYRRQEAQWLLAPPDGDFWGGWQGSGGPRLTLIYPERDGAVASRLAGDLDTLIDTICRTLDGMNCPAALHVQARLEQHPVHLQRLLESEVTMSAGQSIDLPALSLIGLPLNEAAYQAIYRAYGAHVAAAVIAEKVAWSCCERAPFYQAMLDKQLSQLGLRPWPVNGDHYHSMLHSPPRLLQLARYWHRSLPVMATLEDGWLLYAFVDFALHVAPELSVAERQRQLSQAEDYTHWVRQALNSPDDTADVWQWDRNWLLFAQSQLAPESAGSAWPEHEIALACWPTAVEATDGDGYPLALRRLQAGSGDWLPGPELILEPLGRRSPQTGLPMRGFTALPLPEYKGTVLQVETTTETGRQRLQLFGWQGDNVETLFDSAETWPEHQPRLLEFTGIIDYHPYTYWSRIGHQPRLFEFTGIIDPAGELLLFRDYPSALGAFAFWLFDTAACRRGACDFQGLPGRPLWSPDGAHTLLVSDVTRADWGQPVSLLLADRWGANAVPLAEGYAPFWLDNERVGYFQRGPVAALFTTSVAGAQSERWFEFADLTSLLPEDGATEHWLVGQAAVHPDDPDWLFLLLEARQRYVVSFNRRTGEQVIYPWPDVLDESDFVHLSAGGLHVATTRCAEANCWRSEQFQFSPDGRWLAVVIEHLYDASGNVWLSFHDLQQELPPRLVTVPLNVDTIRSHGWSADGRWFLLPHSGVIGVYSPTAVAFHYRVLEQNCFFAGWIESQH
jgi:hypothetical protein